MNESISLVHWFLIQRSKAYSSLKTIIKCLYLIIYAIVDVVECLVILQILGTSQLIPATQKKKLQRFRTQRQICLT